LPSREPAAAVTAATGLEIPAGSTAHVLKPPRAAAPEAGIVEMPPAATSAKVASVEAVPAALPVGAVTAAAVPEAPAGSIAATLAALAKAAEAGFKSELLADAKDGKDETALLQVTIGCAAEGVEKDIASTHTDSAEPAPLEVGAIFTTEPVAGWKGGKDESAHSQATTGRAADGAEKDVASAHVDAAELASPGVDVGASSMEDELNDKFEDGFKKEFFVEGKDGKDKMARLHVTIDRAAEGAEKDLARMRAEGAEKNAARVRTDSAELASHEVDFENRAKKELVVESKGGMDETAHLHIMSDGAGDAVAKDAAGLRHELAELESLAADDTSLEELVAESAAAHAEMAAQAEAALSALCRGDTDVSSTKAQACLVSGVAPRRLGAPVWKDPPAPPVAVAAAAKYRTEAGTSWEAWFASLLDKPEVDEEASSPTTVTTATGARTSSPCAAGAWQRRQSRRVGVPPGSDQPHVALEETVAASEALPQQTRTAKRPAEDGGLESRDVPGPPPKKAPALLERMPGVAPPPRQAT